MGTGRSWLASIPPTRSSTPAVRIAVVWCLHRPWPMAAPNWRSANLRSCVPVCSATTYACVHPFPSWKIPSTFHVHNKSIPFPSTFPATCHRAGSISTTHFGGCDKPTAHVVASTREATIDDGARGGGPEDGPVGRAERHGAVCGALRLRRIQETRTTGGGAARRCVASMQEARRNT